MWFVGDVNILKYHQQKSPMQIIKINLILKYGKVKKMQTIKIRPELTAIHRRNISVPLQTILNNLREEDKILDYGCGHGYDLNFLKKNGFNIKGFDKYIKTFSDEDYSKWKYDVIYCFYVLNVIAEESERIEVLSQIKNALKSSGEVYIAVRSEHELKRSKSKLNKYKDGVVTSKNTFQKYFSEEDLTSLLENQFSEYEIKDIKINKNTILKHIKPRNFQ